MVHYWGSLKPNQKAGLWRTLFLLCVCMFSVTQSCLTLCDPMDYSPPGSSVHGIFQARILEWVAISFSRGSFQPRDWNCVACISCIGRWILYYCTAWEAHFILHLVERWIDGIKTAAQWRTQGRTMSSPSLLIPHNHPGSEGRALIRPRTSCEYTLCQELTERNSLVVQWLVLSPFTAKGPVSIPGWWNKIPRATWHSQQNSNNKEPTMYQRLCHHFHSLCLWMLTPLKIATISISQ